MTHELFEQLKLSGHAGLVLHSSGTTGEPKIVLHDWNLLVKDALSRRHPKNRNKVVLAMLGMDHIGGVNTLLFCLANQCRLVFPKARTPKAVCAAIEEYEVNILPTTPSFLRMLLLSGAHFNHNMDSLQVISYGTESMSIQLLNSCMDAFPKVKFKQTYGLTETGILRTQSEDGRSIRMKIGGNTRVVDGMLEVQTETSMLGYLNAPSPYTEDGWYKTGDKVDVDGEFYTIQGRESDFINVGGEKVNPLKVEAVIMKMPGVLDCVAYGVTNPILGQVVGIRVQCKESMTSPVLKRMVKLLCRPHLSRQEMPIHIERTDLSLVNSRGKKVRKTEFVEVSNDNV